MYRARQGDGSYIYSEVVLSSFSLVGYHLDTSNMHQHITPLLIIALWSVSSFAAPEVIIGDTTIIGRDIQPLGQEFFGSEWKQFLDNLLSPTISDIPFAEPPLVSLRLAPPVPKFEPGVGQLDASEFGFSCPQAVLSSLNN